MGLGHARANCYCVKQKFCLDFISMRGVRFML